MNKYMVIGKQIHNQTEELVLNYMNQSEKCQPNAEGIKHAQLFRKCKLGRTTECDFNTTKVLTCRLVVDFGK